MPVQISYSKHQLTIDERHNGCGLQYVNTCNTISLCQYISLEFLWTRSPFCFLTRLLQDSLIDHTFLLCLGLYHIAWPTAIQCLWFAHNPGCYINSVLYCTLLYCISSLELYSHSDNNGLHTDSQFHDIQYSNTEFCNASLMTANRCMAP